MAYINGPTRTFQASAALGQYRRVKLDGSNQLEYAGATDTDCLGVTMEPALAADEYISVLLLTAEGTTPTVAHAAFSQEATLYAAASGRVDDSGTVIVGVALEAATAQDDIIEVLAAPAPVLGSVDRSSLTQDDAEAYAIPVDSLRVWDAPTTLITTAGTDDLGIADNTFGTLDPSAVTGDAKATTVTQKARFAFPVPPEYVDGQTVTLSVTAGMKTTVSDGTATLDAEVVRRAAPTVDVCATAAQSINSLTAAAKSFTITPTNVVAGDILDVVLTVAITDSATGTAVIGEIGDIKMLLDIKG